MMNRTDITNLSDIDWDSIEMHPFSGAEGYEPRPEYSQIEQGRKRYKVILTAKTVWPIFKIFIIIGTCLVMKETINYQHKIEDGTVEPPAFNELASLVYVLFGMVLAIFVLFVLLKRM